MNRRALMIAAAATVVVAPAKACEQAEVDRLRDALERIALLDEADGHELTWVHASQAVGIASQTLGKHPSEIFVERNAREGRVARP
jgi:hypothetical protein